MKTSFICLLVTILLMQPLTRLQAKSSTAECKQLIEETISNQIKVAELFENTQSIFVAVVCRKPKLPIYEGIDKSIDEPIFELLHARMYAPEVLAKTTPVVSFSKLKQAINPNGKSNTTGILAVSREDLNQFTLKLRTRLASGEAIDINKQANLAGGQSIIFEFSRISIGLVRLPN